jgi:hypothetical protein
MNNMKINKIFNINDIYFYIGIYIIIAITILYVYRYNINNIFWKKNYNEYMSQLHENIKWTETNAQVHVIITKFNETNIEKMIEPLKNKKNVTIYIYNKGTKIDDALFADTTNVRIIEIPNLGWDSYAYFKHVIDHYDNLPDYIYLLHASVSQLNHKMILYKNLINKSNELDVNINNKYYYGGDISTTSGDFTLSDWNATNIYNRIIGNKFTISNIRPFKKWIESKINKIPDNMIDDNNNIKVNYFGMFVVSKSNILRYDKNWYKNILSEISVWQSEVNHYLERSWYIFYN